MTALELPFKGQDIQPENRNTLYKTQRPGPCPKDLSKHHRSVSRTQRDQWGATNQKQQHGQIMMAVAIDLCLSAAKEKFPEGDVNRTGSFALALECKVFASTADDKSKNQREYGEMW